MRHSPLTTILALLLALALAAPARADDELQRPISGRVVQVSQVGDLFVHLDTDGDGRGDLWAKLEADKTELADADGAPVTLDAVAVGALLTLTRYEFEDGYYEVERAVVGAGSPDGAGALAGVIVSAFAFGDHTRVTLDLDDDGRDEQALKVKHNGLILDPQGRALDASALRPGAFLHVLSAGRDAEGTLVSWHVAVGAGALSEAVYPTVAGTVHERAPLDGYLYLTLTGGAGGPQSQNRGPNEAPGRNSVRLHPATSIEDEAGNPLTLDDVQVGTELRVERYAFREGFFEAQRVVVLR